MSENSQADIALVQAEEADAVQPLKDKASPMDEQDNVMDPVQPVSPKPAVQLNNSHVEIIQESKGPDEAGGQEVLVEQGEVKDAAEVNGDVLEVNGEDPALVTSTTSSDPPVVEQSDGGPTDPDGAPQAQEVQPGEDNALRLVDMTSVVTPQLGVESEVARLTLTPLDETATTSPDKAEEVSDSAQVQEEEEEEAVVNTVDNAEPSESQAEVPIDTTHSEAQPPAGDEAMDSHQATSPDPPEQASVEMMVQAAPSEAPKDEILGTAVESTQNDAKDDMDDKPSPPPLSPVSDNMDVIKTEEVASVPDVHGMGDVTVEKDTELSDSYAGVSETSDSAVTVGDSVSEETGPSDQRPSEGDSLPQGHGELDMSDQGAKEHDSALQQNTDVAETKPPESETSVSNDLDDWSMNIDNSNTTPASQITEETSSTSLLEDIDAVLVDEAEIDTMPSSQETDSQASPAEAPQELNTTANSQTQDASSIILPSEAEASQPTPPADVTTTAESGLELQPADSPTQQEIPTSTSEISPAEEQEEKDSMLARPEPLQLSEALLPDIAEEPESPMSAPDVDASPGVLAGSNRRPLEMPSPTEEGEHHLRLYVYNAKNLLTI